MKWGLNRESCKEKNWNFWGKTECRVRKWRRKSYSKGEKDGREVASWTRASKNEAECRWGKERGRNPLFSHTRLVPTADLANPCLNWGRIPAHMFPWNERRAKGEESLGASDTSDEPRRLGWCTMCECTLLEYKHASRLSARLTHKWL